MHFSPATWQLIVTFTPCTVLMVLPTSTAMAASSVLITVPRDVFTSGFPEGGKECEILLDGDCGLRAFPWNTGVTHNEQLVYPGFSHWSCFPLKKIVTAQYRNHPSIRSSTTEFQEKNTDWRIWGWSIVSNKLWWFVHFIIKFTNDIIALIFKGLLLLFLKILSNFFNQHGTQT